MKTLNWRDEEQVFGNVFSVKIHVLIHGKLIDFHYNSFKSW